MTADLKPAELKSLSALFARAMAPAAGGGTRNDFVAALVAACLEPINREFASRQLVRLTTDPLPTAKTQLSSYRTRLGMMLEYALAARMDAILCRLTPTGARATLVAHHSYPDIEIRDAGLRSRIRVEVKVVDGDSDEQAARFEALVPNIDARRDVVALLAWRWRATERDGVMGVWPELFDSVCTPAVELAEERDRCLTLRGGYADATGFWVRSRRDRAVFGRDGGNTGKVFRLIHGSRRYEDLTPAMKAYADFVGRLRPSRAIRETE